MKSIVKPGVLPVTIEYEPVEGGMRIRRRADTTGATVEHTIPGLTENQLKAWAEGSMFI